MSKALLVIDMQEAYVGERCASYLKYDKPALLRAVNDVIDARSGEGCMVVYVRNVTKRSLIKRLALFKVYEGTPESELVEGLHVVSDHVFVKYVGDVLSNPELRVFLKQNGVESVEIVGVDGGGCVALTALGAIENGYQSTSGPSARRSNAAKRSISKNYENWAPNSSDGSQPSARIFFRSPNVFLRFAGLPACGRRLSGNLQKDVFLFVH